MKKPLQAIAAVLSYVLLCNQFAHAAELPRALDQTQTAAPIKRQTPEPQPSTSPEAIAQTRLRAAHNLYIVNDGADRNFPGDPSYGKDHFVANLRSWGRYHIVSNVHDADLILQLHSAAPAEGTLNPPSVSTPDGPYFRLTIADPTAPLKPLWVITVPVRTGISKKDKTDLFVQSTQNVTSQLKLLVGEPLSQQEQAVLVQPIPSRPAYPTFHARESHHGLIWGIAGGAAIVGMAIAVPLIMKSNFDQAKEDAEKKQHDFCVQNHFPNCPA